MDLHQAPEAYSRVVHYDKVKEVQIRLTINTFRGVEYMHLRKYYMDFDEEWKPTPEGIAMPLDLSNSRELGMRLLMQCHIHTKCTRYRSVLPIRLLP